MASRMKLAVGAALLAALATPAIAQTDAEAAAKALETASAEGVVSSAQSCEYEGGTVMDLAAGKICFIAVRGEELAVAAYDGMRLGVNRCSGNGAFANELVQPSGEFCRIFLEQKKVAPSREEVEAATRASMEAEGVN